MHVVKEKPVVGNKSVLQQEPAASQTELHIADERVVAPGERSGAERDGGET